MIVVAQAGQAGKTNYLFDMHRLRKRVFHDRMKWPVTVDAMGLETDQFDLPETIYLLALNDDKRVIGTWRMLPTTGSNMIRDIWPQFLESLPMPNDPFVWEVSRFAIDQPESNSEKHINQINYATAELFCGLTELCLYSGIRQIYTLYDMRIARLLKRLDCAPARVSERLRIDNIQVEIGCFDTNMSMLTRLRDATGIKDSVIDFNDLPPAFDDLKSDLPLLIPPTPLIGPSSLQTLSSQSTF
jgi:acyl homoserine lactone synthase